MSGKLYLIPSTISESNHNRDIPPFINQTISKINHYIVENERTARRMLIKMGIPTPIDELTFYVLNKYTKQEDIPQFLEKIESQDIGLLSEAGVPAVADPGSNVVAIAHSKNIEVVPLTGPSSILLALMASGLNGQNFAFNGYLPIKPIERKKKIKELEQRSRSENQSQIFIEAPYRNNAMFDTIISTCDKHTMLCVAADITDETEYISTKPIWKWKKKKPDLHKRPVIFIIHKSP